MTKTPDQKIAYSARRELRINRLKTATALMPWFMAHRPELTLREQAKLAAAAADVLIDEVERSAATAGPGGAGREG